MLILTSRPLLVKLVKSARASSLVTTSQPLVGVWQTSTTGLAKITSAQPVLGVYVNGPNGEFALREVIHGQADQYPSDPKLPSQTQADIKDNSGDFYYDASNHILYADFGRSLGPNGLMAARQAPTRQASCKTT
jgi:hypothetical protein